MIGSRLKARACSPACPRCHPRRENLSQNRQSFLSRPQEMSVLDRDSTRHPTYTLLGLPRPLWPPARDSGSQASIWGWVRASPYVQTGGVLAAGVVSHARPIMATPWSAMRAAPASGALLTAAKAGRRTAGTAVCSGRIHTMEGMHTRCSTNMVPGRRALQPKYEP